MNKYQEALDYLRWIGGDGYYKEQREKSFDILQKLLDKATPMKPFKETQDISGRPLKTESNLLTRLHYSCPRCRVSQKHFYPYSFCAKCGQKIDWSEENE